jgi:hypothetical protein
MSNQKDTQAQLAETVRIAGVLLDNLRLLNTDPNPMFHLLVLPEIGKAAEIYRQLQLIETTLERG